MAERLVEHDVELAGAGMRIKSSPLFLDAPHPTELSFVSHAHADHAARHRTVVATAPTLRLLAHRVGAIPSPLAAPYGKTFELGSLNLELLPAGHILGSAQLRVVRHGRRIVYTGDLNTAPSLTAEPIETAFADTLVIETTFGHPRYRFPPREDVHAEILTFVRRALEDGAVPVLFAYALGKAQEAMKLVTDAGFSAAAHANVAEVTDLYAELGCPIPYRRFDGASRPNEVLFFPPNLTRSRALDHLGKQRTAILTGWAVDAGTRFRHGTDAAIPFSDHADFQGLVSYVKATEAKRILTVHGFAKEFAAWLRDHGHDAQPLEQPKQLELF